MNPFANEKIFVYTPSSLRETVASVLADEIPFAGNDPRAAHKFLGWALQRAFLQMTGYEPDGFVSNQSMEDLYSLVSLSVERFMFAVINDLGPQNIKEHLRYNLVLTYERLYVITY